MQKLRLFKVLKISIHLYRGSHDGGQENAHEPILLYNIIENSPTYFARNSVLAGPNSFKFGAATYQNLGQISRNLHNLFSMHKQYVKIKLMQNETNRWSIFLVKTKYW